MKSLLHRMQIPREVWVGAGIIEKIPELCSVLGYKPGSKILIMQGPITGKIAGEGIKENLENRGYVVHVFLVRKADSKNISDARKTIKEKGVRLVLGVGGGKNIDVAKMASSKEGVPFISVPTVASHDGITSPRASIRARGKPYSVQAQAPIAILADIEIINKAPYRFTASGCGDIISNFTAVKDWLLAHKLKGEYYGHYAAALSLTSAKHIVENADLIRNKSEEGVRIVVEALIGSGVAMAIAGNSRPASGSEHLFSHALDLLASKPALHGEQCGIGAIMMMYLHDGNWKEIRGTLKKIGAPVTARELRINGETIIEALCTAHKIRPGRYTILGEKGLTREAARELAEKTRVI